jgi:hypothetical protein
MKNVNWIGVILAGLSVATIVAAQGGPSHSPPYDVKSEVVIKGKVAAVAAIPDWMGSQGVNITLETPESTAVHVDTAPSEFLKMLDFAIANGDSLEVTGVWGLWNGNKVFLARVVTRNKVAIVVRDPEGKPVW